MLPNSEWILLAVLAVILLKPEDIPVIARFVAKFVRQTQKMWSDIVPEFDKTSTNAELQKKHPFHSAPLKANIAPLKD